MSENLFSAFASAFEARRNAEMPLKDFLDACGSDPLLYANAAERLLAAIGEPEMVDTAKDPRLGRVTRDGVAVKLTSHEFRVLSYLMHHRDRIVSQPELTDHIYAQDFDRDSNTVEVFVARLRRKLGSALITTVRGLGYRLGDAR